VRLSTASERFISRGRCRPLKFCFKKKKTKESRQMAIDIGIAKKDREAVAKHLSKLLADTYSLHLKIHNFHWNVTGPQFNSLHAMFEVQYTAL